MNDTNSEAGTQAGKHRMDGSDLAAMFAAGAIALRRNVDAINALNVFPVIDGDTGTNMYLTMQSGVDDVTALDTPTVSVVASAMYSRTVKTPGGNSGTILSQFLKGFADGLQGKVDCGVEDFARSCQLAKENAYKAVADPVEGTMLTVITSVAEAAREAADAGRDLQLTLQLISDRAGETVARTTEMLPVLQAAGVVDSGGQGLAVALEGFRRSVTNEDPDDDNYPIQTPEGATSAQVSKEFLYAHADDVYGYCTQFLVEVDRLDVDELRARVSSIADSVVVIADGSSASVHGHTKDPGQLVSLGVSLGLMSKLSEVKIENMDAQHAEFSSSQGVGAQTEEAKTNVGPSVVAVAWGYGIERVFREQGAAQIVTGGNTMNPSVRDLMTAIDRTRADTVYLLPNNKNIVPTAKQAAERSSKDVRVVETVSIPQGIVAMDDVLQGIESDLDEVKSGEITRAVRDASMDGVAVREGQYIGLLDGSLVATGDGLQETLLDLIGKAEVTDDTHIRLFHGVMVSESDANDCAKAIQEEYHPWETVVIYGGQPHYEFIISIE